MQIGGMVGHYDPKVRPALIRVASEMRSNGEAMNDRDKRRILSSFNPGLTTAGELKETLTAVPPKDAWATFLWLDEKSTDQRVQHEFVQAALLEIEGKGPEALAMFEALQHELKARGYSGRLADNVAGAVRRLSR